MEFLSPEFHETCLYKDVPDLWSILPGVKYDGDTIKFCERLGSLVYRGVCSTRQKDVVVNFLQKKNRTDMHRYLNSFGYAPDILCVESVGLWFACVMTNLRGQSLFQYTQMDSLPGKAAIGSICQQLGHIQSLLNTQVLCPWGFAFQ